MYIYLYNVYIYIYIYRFITCGLGLFKQNRASRQGARYIYIFGNLWLQTIWNIHGEFSLKKKSADIEAEEWGWTRTQFVWRFVAIRPASILSSDIPLAERVVATWSQWWEVESNIVESHDPSYDLQYIKLECIGDLPLINCAKIFVSLHIIIYHYVSLWLKTCVLSLFAIIYKSCPFSCFIPGIVFFFDAEPVCHGSEPRRKNKEVWVVAATVGCSPWPIRYGIFNGFKAHCQHGSLTWEHHP